ncbi:MAG TPA: hypothetical protein VFZ61_07235 [Polyangiales bacterium]
MDPHIELLRTLFLTHPAWRAASDNLKDGSSSRVLFSHVQGEYHLLRRGQANLLLEGPAKDPDLAFRFTPRAIERLSRVKSNDIADFALELLDCCASSDPEVQVRVLVISSFPRLLLRGYATTLLKAGPRVLKGGSGGGHVGISDARKWLAAMRDHSAWVE